MKNNQNGFTLLEVLIAITVLSFIMIGVIAMTSSTQNTADRVISEDRENLQIETAMARFEWDFSHIYSPMFFSHVKRPDQLSKEEKPIVTRMLAKLRQKPKFNTLSFENILVPLFSSDGKNSLTFFTASNRRKLQNIKQSNYAWVRYSIAKDTSKDSNGDLLGGNMLVRQFAPDNAFDNKKIEWDRIKSQVLVRKVIKMVISYWDPKKAKWVENLKSVKNGRNIIYAIKVTINMKDASDVDRLIIRVFRPLFPIFKSEDQYKKPGGIR